MFLVLVTLIPQDLRLAQQLLHTRLSPAVTGLHEDEAADFEVIRDDWVRNKMASTITNDRRSVRYVPDVHQWPGIVGLTEWSVRIGTFNVNGKLPSQDLSGWIKGPIRTVGPSTIGSFRGATSTVSLGETAEEHGKYGNITSLCCPNGLLIATVAHSGS